MDIVHIYMCVHVLLNHQTQSFREQPQIRRINLSDSMVSMAKCFRTVHQISRHFLVKIPFVSICHLHFAAVLDTCSEFRRGVSAFGAGEFWLCIHSGGLVDIPSFALQKGRSWQEGYAVDQESRGVNKSRSLNQNAESMKSRIITVICAGGCTVV